MWGTWAIQDLHTKCRREQTDNYKEQNLRISFYSSTAFNRLFIATKSDFPIEEFWEAAVRGLFYKICLKKGQFGRFLLVFLHKYCLFPCRQGPCLLALKKSGAPPDPLPSESGSGNLTSSLVTNIRNTN